MTFTLFNLLKFIPCWCCRSLLFFGSTSVQKTPAGHPLAFLTYPSLDSMEESLQEESLSEGPTSPGKSLVRPDP